MKIYGEAPVTVSVSMVTVAFDEFGVAGRSVSTNGSKYVNTVSLVTFCTFVDIL